MSKKILIKEDALKGAIDAMSAVGVNMRLNAPQLSGKSWGDLDIAKAALSEALEQPATPPAAAQPAVPDFKAFKAWANDAGYDTAYTHDGIKWICLNPMTADLWKAWKAAHGIKEKNNG